MKHSGPGPAPCYWHNGAETQHSWMLSPQPQKCNISELPVLWVKLDEHSLILFSQEFLSEKHSRDTTGMLYFSAVIRHYVLPLESQPYRLIQRNSEVRKDWQKPSQDHRNTHVHRESGSIFLLHDSNLRGKKETH